jgi:L-lactate permease
MNFDMTAFVPKLPGAEGQIGSAMTTTPSVSFASAPAPQKSLPFGFGMGNGPLLTEPGVKYFLDGTLKNCSKVKKSYNAFYFNSFLFCIMSAVVCGFLYYKYKQKQKLELKGSTKKEEIKQQMTDYMLNKFKEMSQKSGQYNEHGNEITNLPPIENPVEFIHKKFL